MVLPPPSGVVTFLTDFGVTDPYVGTMKGAVLRQHRTAVLVDLCHEIPPQDLDVAAFWVGAAVGRFPTGTVHVVVVDPGVGTERRALAVAAADGYWIAPDNGVLTPVLERDGAEVLALDLERLGLAPESHTFHGRDVFAPVAGMLSRGHFGFRALGGRVGDAVRLEKRAPGRVVVVDRFGNLITDLEPGARPLRGVRVAGREIALRRTYGEVPDGELLALVGSFGTIEVAVRGGNAGERLGVGRGTRVEPLEA